MNGSHSVRTLVLAALVIVAGGNAPTSWSQQLLVNEGEKIDFAQGLRQQGQYSLAVSQFEEFIAQFPQSALVADAYLGAGESWFFLKEYDKAVEQFQNYLTNFPNGKDAGIVRVRLGQTFYVQGKPEDALKHFDGVALETLNPQFKQTLHFFKGQILAAQNKEADAIGSLQLALENAEATAYNAQVYFKLGSLIAQKDPNAALEKYAKALEFADNSEIKASISLKQGEAYYLLKQYDAAEKVFRETTMAYPSLPVVTDAVASWFAVLIQQKNYSAVIENFNQLLGGVVEKPEYIQAYLSVAKAMSLSANADGAVALLDKIAALAGISEPNKAALLLQKARVYFENGKFTEAVTFIDGNLSADAGTKSAMLVLKAKAYMSLKDYDKAWAVYEQVSRDFAGLPVMAEALCGMAYVRYAQEQFEPAAGLFLDCYGKTQEENLRADAIYNGFVSYRKAGNDEKTMEVAEEYIAKAPAGKNQAEVAISLAGIYSKRQLYDKASEVLAPYLNDPDETKRRNALFQSAYNLQLSGKTEEALKTYEAFMTDGKNDRLAYLAHKNSIMMFLQSKDDEKAAELLTKAINGFQDNDFPLRSYLWLVEYWQAKIDAAKMLEVLAVAEKHHAQDAQSAGVRFFKGQAFRMQDDCKQALENYELAIKNDTGSGYKGRARLGKGICLTGIGDYEGAQKELEQAVVDSPEDAFVAMRARFALANNATYLKNFDMAAKLYLVVDVLYNDPEYAPKALLRAGDILKEQLNNNKEAMNAYTKIVEVYPNSPEAALAKEKLAQVK